MDYLNFYKLDVEPFQSDPDSRFYFESDVQRQARLRLTRGIYQRKGLSLLIGGPGCGKTTLAHHLLENLGDDRWAVRMAVIPHAACPSGWLLRSIAKIFGVAQPASDTLAALAQVSKVLVGLASQGTYPVLFVDEAQLLSNKAVLEDFRALLNLLHRGRKLISLVLFGLHSLDEVLRLEPSLAQRVEIRVEMGPMDREQSAAYVRHRIARAGGSGEIFSPDALDALYTYSNGVPRPISILADNALFEGAMEQSQHINRSHIIAAADQLGLETCVAPASRVNQWRPGAPERRRETSPPEPKETLLTPLEPPSAPISAPPERDAPAFARPPAPEPSPESAEAEGPTDTLTAISLVDDDTDVSMEQLIAQMDEAENAAVAESPAVAEETPTLEPAVADEDLAEWLEGFDDHEESPVAAPPVARNPVPANLDSEEDSLDTSDKFESLWSELQPDDSGLPPAASPAPPSASARSPSQDEQATVVGIRPGPELAPSPRTAAGQSAEASADEIDALFDDIRLDD